jgi:hypothetical protein
LQIRLSPPIRLPPILTAGNLIAPPFALHVLFYGSIIAILQYAKNYRKNPSRYDPYFGQMAPVGMAAPALGVLRNSREKKAIDV